MGRSNWVQRIRSLYAWVLSAALVAGCGGGGGGQLYVSQPQVHNRERLVNERQGEIQWLREQLDKTDQIQTTFQGIRDMRQMTALYGEVAGTVDPWKLELARLRHENDVLAERRRRYALLAGVVALDKPGDRPAAGRGDSRLDGSSGEGKSQKATGAKQEGEAGALASESQLEWLADQLGKLSGDQGLPDPATVETSRAQAGLLDLFHDKLAYRNAINAQIRSTQLDDTHDLGGLMLYELTLHTALVPGRQENRLAQVTLRIEPSNLDRDRVGQLHALYHRWRHSLQTKLVSDVYQMQMRYTAGRLTDRDRQLLAWCAGRRLQATLQRLERERQDAVEVLDQIEKAAQNGSIDQEEADGIERLVWTTRSFLLLTPEIVREWEKLVASGKVSDAAQELPTSIRRAVASAIRGDDEDDDAAEGQDGKTDQQKLLSAFKNAKRRMKDMNVGKRCLRKLIKALKEPGAPSSLYEGSQILDRQARAMIGWAAYARHALPLRRIVIVTPPEFDPDGWLVGGLRVNEVAATKGESAGYESVPAPKSLWDGIALVNRPEAVGHKSTSQDPPPASQAERSAWPFSDTGAVTFITRLARLEGDPFAVTVEPKEYAQNISEAAARHSALQLVAALKASAGSSASLDAGMEYLRKTERRLHAIARKPLLIGFGQGGREFGWVLGPRFAITEAGEDTFEHAAVRHDCAAGVVVPAWWTYMRLSGSYRWVKPNLLQRDRPLWDGKQIVLPLRPPPDMTARIVEALVQNNPSDEEFLYSSRPRPVVDWPGSQHSSSGGDPSQPRPAVLRASAETGQHVLILGQELWRNPQVFIGSQPASRIRILSDMNGLLAEFHHVAWPASPQPLSEEGCWQDLHVITSFGSVTKPRAVRVLPPLAKKPGPPPVSLVARFVEGQDPILALRWPQPAAYGRAYIEYWPKGDRTDPSEADVRKWEAGKAFIELEAAGDQIPRIWCARAFVQPRQDDKVDLRQVTPRPLEFAWFDSTNDRSFTTSVRGLKFVEREGDSGDQTQVELSPAEVADFTLERGNTEGWAIAYPGFAPDLPGGYRLHFGRDGEVAASIRLVGTGKGSLKIRSEELTARKLKALKKEGQVQLRVVPQNSAFGWSIPVDCGADVFTITVEQGDQEGDE